MESTQIVAWWGAVVATLVLLWDVLKWVRSGPRLKTRVALNIHYGDGKVISKEKIDNGDIVTYEQYCHIELVNVGDMPTTVMGISCTHKEKRGFGQAGLTQQAFTEHYGKKLPHVINPGEVWSCRLPMGHYKSILQHGTPEIQVHLSHLKKPLVARAKKAANKALKQDAEELGAL